MNVVLIVVDSLNRHFLPAYDQSTEFDVQTPHIDELAQRGVRFDNHFVGSLPCMPARREMLTGIQEFLWRPWGPLEPFDNPLPRVAREHGYVTQLITDHFHYFQHGSHGYFTDFQGFEFIRGHEFDAWKTAPIQPNEDFIRQLLVDPEQSTTAFLNRIAYARNSATIREEKEFMAPRVFQSAADWIVENHNQSKFFLMIDCFDVHEPFHVPSHYAHMYTDEDIHDPHLTIWPHYGQLTKDGPQYLTERQVAFVRSQYAAKITLVDTWLGRFLHQIEQYHLWDDTMIVLTTDHGHYLGEHGWMGKPNCLNYNVLTRIPLIIYHPEVSRGGQTVSGLTATVDLYATIREVMGCPIEGTSHSRSLIPFLGNPQHTGAQWAVYGYFGQDLNITNGTYTYHMAPQPRSPLYLYSTAFMNATNWFRPVQVPQEVEVGHFLPYTNSPLWRYPVDVTTRSHAPQLFNIREDPMQDQNLAPLQTSTCSEMERLAQSALQELQGPRELWERFQFVTK